MDQIDLAILRELQRDGRISNQELSERVGLSPSPCLRRVRQLERQGVITGYRAVVDYEACGLPITAFVMVRLEKQSEETIRTFEKGLGRLSNVLAGYLTSGSFDYMLHVVCASLKDYENFIRDDLTRIPGIGSLESHFVFGDIPVARLVFDR